MVCVRFVRSVSIPYWLGSKLRALRVAVDGGSHPLFQSPIGWGLSCERGYRSIPVLRVPRFNPLLVGV